MNLPDIKLPESDEALEALAGLPAVFQAYGYSEGSIRNLLGVGDPGQLECDRIPNYIWRCRQDNSILALLTAFFLLHQPVRRQALEEYLGEEETEALESAGVVTTEDGVASATVDLYPVFGRFVFTDSVLAQVQPPGHVYELGADSYAITRVTPRKKCLKTLDLCTGSGIHAILSGAHCDDVVAVDINPRAVAYARLNAHMNGVKMQVFEGDLFEPIPDGPYDLITMNPPFVPSPDQSIPIHRSPGETGEEVSSKVVAALPRYLAEDGLFSMVLDYPVLKTSTYLERLSNWLGQSHGWGIAVLDFGTVPREKYILNQLDFNAGWEGFEERFAAYLDSYERLGIAEVGFANVFIKRLSSKAPTWGHVFKTNVPSVFLCDRVEEWMEGLEEYGEPDWEPDWDYWKPRRSRHYKALWRDEKKQRGFLESADLSWCQPVSLDRNQALLVSRLQGKKTAQELLDGWAKTRRKPVDEVRQEFTSLLRFLGCQSVLARD